LFIWVKTKVFGPFSSEELARLRLRAIIKINCRPYWDSGAHRWSALEGRHRRRDITAVRLPSHVAASLAQDEAICHNLRSNFRKNQKWFQTPAVICDSGAILTKAQAWPFKQLVLMSLMVKRDKSDERYTSLADMYACRRHMGFHLPLGARS